MSDYTHVVELKSYSVNIRGQKFGRLTALEPFANARRTLYWLCECDCGVTKLVQGTKLRSGHTKSCGCLRGEVVSGANTTHGLSASRTYEVYSGMKKRCLNQNSKSYADYGARGIKICDRWLHSFENFLADMGERPEGHTLERDNNDGPYSPENCRWATRQEQACNTRRNRFITFQGLTLTVDAWERRLRLRPNSVGQRLRRGWDAERALTAPFTRSRRR